MLAARRTPTVENDLVTRCSALTLIFAKCHSYRLQLLNS